VVGRIAGTELPVTSKMLRASVLLPVQSVAFDGAASLFTFILPHIAFSNWVTS